MTFGTTLVIMKPLSVGYVKLRSVMQRHSNRKVNEENLLIMVNCGSLKRSFFNKLNNFTFICLMLL